MPSNAYEDTRVSVAQSKAQIEKLLKKFNVKAMRFTTYPAVATLEFVRTQGDVILPYRITVKPKLREFARNAGTELDRAERQVWRVVYWWLKAKLEAVEFGLVEFEQDFLPYLLLETEKGVSPVAEVFFERLAGKVALPDDPFKGLRPALPQGDVKAEKGMMERSRESR